MEIKSKKRRNSLDTDVRLSKLTRKDELNFDESRMFFQNLKEARANFQKFKKDFVDHSTNYYFPYYGNALETAINSFKDDELLYLYDNFSGNGPFSIPVFVVKSRSDYTNQKPTECVLYKMMHSYSGFVYSYWDVKTILDLNLCDYLNPRHVTIYDEFHQHVRNVNPNEDLKSLFTLLSHKFTICTYLQVNLVPFVSFAQKIEWKNSAQTFQFKTLAVSQIIAHHIFNKEHIESFELDPFLNTVQEHVFNIHVSKLISSFLLLVPSDKEYASWLADLHITNGFIQFTPPIQIGFTAQQAEKINLRKDERNNLDFIISFHKDTGYLKRVQRNYLGPFKFHRMNNCKESDLSADELIDEFLEL